LFFPEHLFIISLPLTSLPVKEDIVPMPLYEYACSVCGGRFEALQRFSDPPLAVCRLCNAPSVKKVLSPPAFVLKGSGWYVTDYPSEDRKKASESEKPAAPSTETKAPTGASTACASGACPAKN
jgi:putative FmdB family regulatory protein